MSKTKKIIGMCLIVVLTLSMLVGCNGDSKEGSAGKDSLIIATENEPPSLATTDHDAISSVYMNLLTYNGLMKITSDTLEVVPDLAESYHVEDDTNWIFELKKSVLFHDGSELTADDVVASIEWAKTFPDSANYTQKISKIEAVDDHTVKITTDGPYSGLLYDLAYHFNFIVPKELIDSGHDFNSKPIGTGPYKFVKWSRGDSIKFEKNEDYFDEEAMPTITNLEWRFVPEGTSRTIALEAGEVDFIYEVETNDIDRLKSNEDVEVAEVTSVVNWFLMLNKDVEPFNDANFRKAINCAINREAIVDAAVNGYGVSNISCVPMGFEGSSEENASGYDLDKAKEYLEAWGGDPSTVKLPIICSNETKVKVGTVIQSNLAELGIEVDIDSMDYGTYLDKTSSGDYVSAIVSWSPSNLLTYVQRFHSRRRESNPGALNSPEMDALVEKAETTIDEEERAKIISEIIGLGNDLCHQPSLYQDVLFRAYDADLEGITPSATGYVYFNEAYWK